MPDIDKEMRKVPKNWRAYLKESLEIPRVFGWVFRELVTAESRKAAKLSVIYRLVGMLIFAAGPLCLAAAIDVARPGNGNQAVFYIAALVGVYYAGKFFFSRSDRKVERNWGLVMTSIEVRTTELFLSKSLGQHLREDGKLTVANIDKGLNHSRGGIQTLMNFALPSVVELLVGFAFLFVFSPVAGACLGIALLGYLLFHLWMNRRIIEVCTPIDEDFRKANRFRFERLENPERVKTSGKEEEDILKLHEMLTDVVSRDFSFFDRFLVLAFRRGIFGTFMWGLAVAYGFHLASIGVWQAGTAAALMFWANMVRENLYKIGGIELQLNKSVYRVSAMMDALTMPPDVVDKADAIVLKDEPVTIDVENLTHRYSKNGEEGPIVVGGLNFSINPGDRVALIGESGAGKTTVMRLLMRYFDPHEGVIRLNGIPLTDVQLRSWKELMAYVPQQAQIFNLTIGENIRYAMTEKQDALTTDDELERLMKEFRLVGERFKDGLDTLVGRRGIELSGGEAQRVMVLSAIARRPRFLIVDEATSSLDSTTEKLVQKAIDRAVKASGSAFIIAHRLSTVRNCTKFIVLRPYEEVKNGGSQIEATAGSFEELYGLSPTFRRLADDQGIAIGKIALGLNNGRMPAGQNGWWNV